MDKYLNTGRAGFIGSNRVAEILRRGEQARVLNNFSTVTGDFKIYSIPVSNIY